METAAAFEYCHPLTLLTSQASSGASYVRLGDRHLTWHLYFDQGHLVYASHSADPFERLERQLRSLADLLPALTKPVRNEMRSRFAGEGHQAASICADYGAIAWAVGELYIDAITAGTLCSKITAEVIEAYVQLPEANYQVQRQMLRELPVFCSLQISSLLSQVDERLKVWRSLAPHLLSPYQRPYLASKRMARTRLKEKRVQQLTKLLVGFNFRQLGMIVGQDELLFAQRLYPLIADRIILLRPPISPFDYLPYPLHEDDCAEDQGEDPSAFLQERPEQTLLQIGPIVDVEPSEDTLGIGDEAVAGGQTTWQIACVDPGETLVKAIQPLIEDAAIAIAKINDPTQALANFAQHQPDLVFLQTAMEGVDGYELCTLMRKSPPLQNTPIILVTQKKGLFDGARAKMVGATDALASPYSAKDLLSVIFRYLSN